jgi:hypothetical protein
MATLEEILARKKPLMQTLSVKLDVTEGDESVDFTFKALGRKAWRDLVDGHQPDDDQQQQYLERQTQLGVPERKREMLWYNPDTFPAAAIAASLVEPTATVEQAQAMWDSGQFSEAELARIMSLITALNGVADATVNWGKGSGQTPDSETGSPSAEPTESPSPTS